MKSFARIHNTEKGQILITKEYEPEKDFFLISIWFLIEDIGLGKVKIEIKEESSADTAFVRLHDFSVLKAQLNMILNQDFL